MSLVKKYNIALLGKSGAGKSTLVNGLANYMMFDSFKEALRSEEGPICVIPTNYYMESEAGKGYHIQLGTPDPNESHVEGQSCTQNPKIYTFELGDNEYNFIDVPGIGDTRGTAMDAQNRTQILGTLSTFKELHGILILMTTQDSRLTSEYQYCLTEILTMIHRDALDNIFFVFTNSGGQDFRGGQSLPLLRKYLTNLKNETNIAIDISNDKNFFIDNEGFRLQGFYNQHPKAVGRSSLVRSKKSWEHTRREMYRLLNCVQQVKPHMVENSISLNEARTTVVLLLEPLAAITALIAQNTLDVDDDGANMATKVEAALKVVDIEIVKLDKPRTVCTSTSCISASFISGSDRYATTYKQVCHNSCYLEGVQLKTLPEERLRQCAAMGGSTMCNKCAQDDHECSYELHMHIDYEQRTVVRETMLTRDLTKARKSDDSKAAMKKIMKILEKELETIISSVATFMSFLKEHAIYEHNQYFEKRLDVDIRSQEVIAQQTGRNDVVEKLKAIQARHKKNMEKIESIASNMKNPENKSTSAHEILEHRDTLFNLKYNGPKIKEIYDTTAGKVLENARAKETTLITSA